MSLIIAAMSHVNRGERDFRIKFQQPNELQSMSTPTRFVLLTTHQYRKVAATAQLYSELTVEGCGKVSNLPANLILVVEVFTFPGMEEVKQPFVPITNLLQVSAAH